MTFQEVLKQTEKLTTDQKQQLGYYMLFSTLNEDKKQNLLQLFHYKNDFEGLKSKEQINPLKNFFKSKGILKNIDTSDISDEELHLQGD